MHTLSVRLGLMTLLALVLTAVSAAEPDPTVMSHKLPGDLKWTDSAEYPGLKSVVLYGDPTKPGPYAIRNRFSAGVMSRPHTHNTDRFVVVVSGRPAARPCTSRARSTTTAPRMKPAKSSSTAWAR
jgi:hypothetical protein